MLVAVPVGAPEALAALVGDDSPVADDVVCLIAPPDFMAVGMHYIDFRQTTDEEVVRLLAGDL